MKEKERAVKLWSEYLKLRLTPAVAKKCAIIAVEEVIAELRQLRKPEYTTFVWSLGSKSCDGYDKIDYWNEVKTEIEKL